MDEAKDGTEGSGAPPTQQQATTPTATSDAPKVEATGSALDEYGYEKVQTTGDKKPEGKADDKPKQDASAKSTEETDAVELDETTGYSKEAPKLVEDATIDKPAEEVVADPKDEIGYELDLKDLLKGESEKLTEFIKSNKVPKEIADAYVKLRKQEIAEYNSQVTEFQKNQERQKQVQRVAWDKELREDPTFGGEKFERNVKRAQKVYSDFMPETKKALTGKQNVLPPYLMRDLAKLGDTLFKSISPVEGNKPNPNAQAENKVLSEAEQYGYE